MCVIYACTTLLPEDSELARGAGRNDDGAGLAWLSPGKNPTLHYQKGLSSAKEVKEFLRDNKIQFPFVIHFRSASSGGKMKELTHPFPITKDAETDLSGTAPAVLFHNGSVTKWEDYMLQVILSTQEEVPGGPWSDTRSLAWITHLKGTGVLNWLIGTSRIVVMEAAPATLNTKEYSRVRDHIRLWNYSSWVKKDGYMQSIETTYSNRGGVVYSTGFSAYEKEESACGLVKLGIPQAPEPEKPKEKEREVKALGPGSAYVSTPASFPKDEWSVEEFKSFMEKMKEDQDHAKTAAGV